jgi:glycogen synthase
MPSGRTLGWIKCTLYVMEQFLSFVALVVWDTVIDFGDDGNGICHDQSSVGDICYSIGRAIHLYQDKKHLNSKKRNEYRSFMERVCQEIHRYVQLNN